MKIKKVGKNKWRRAKFYEEYEDLIYCVIAVIVWTVILAVYFI